MFVLGLGVFRGFRRHFDISCCSGRTFRLILLFQADISTNPAAPQKTFSCCSRSPGRYMHASHTYNKPR